MNSLFYFMLISPFLVVLIDTMASRNARPSRKIVGYLTFVLALAMLYYRESQLLAWVILPPASLGVFYATQWLSGLGSFLVVFPSFSFICMSLANALPSVGSVFFRYAELLYLPINIATFVVPPLVLWYLWDKLPYVYDTWRKGAWHETGVPLTARHQFLAAIVIVSLVANFLLYSQVTRTRETLNLQANSERYSMFFELKQAADILNYRDREAFKDWHPLVTDHISRYQSAARNLTRLVASGQVYHHGEFYFLAETLPEGLAGALSQPDSLSPEDIDKIRLIAKSVGDAIEQNYSRNALSTTAYKKIADHILAAIKSTDALNMFNVQYNPR